MTKILKSTYVKATIIAISAVLALALVGCTGISSGSSSAQSSSSSTAVVSSSAAAQPSSSSSSIAGTASASSASSPSAASTSSQAASSSASSAAASQGQQSYVSPDPDSYAENNLTSSTYVPPDITVEKSGSYTDKDHVALYIHLYGMVPGNYITKTKARKAGWVQEEGNLDEVLPGKSIGGGGFYNDDHMMPDAPGREWFECDIDYEGGFRNAKRIVYSNDGLIYYTNDHYQTFERLY